ncbi:MULTISPECIES: DsrE family protein [unclassified Modicisalibacter]|uniref:DsrE family protein n=1 Tax=unclassified Modicisalibacter TaxID=2679913 RepID=UPI001CCB48F8|nr:MULTISPECIES: DsrE family protein [unclassified Modicisalibacter]MBZ9556693.1 DsrE family protein [Modicisalibacter sp. R2A 31.J]MBZ9574838.1 DsrE family protein [Modicisalibacter sp. MOD 31.J]
MSEKTAPAMLVILRHAPHDSSWLREGLDVALVAAAFGQRVTLLFLGDGVEALRPGQRAGALGQKGTHPTLDMLAMYDIEDIRVDRDSLERRGLTPDALGWTAAPVDAESLPALIAGSAAVFNF